MKIALLTLVTTAVLFSIVFIILIKWIISKQFQYEKIGAVSVDFLNNIFNTDNLSSNFNELKPFVELELDKFLNEKLPQKMPMISMLIGKKTTLQLKEIFIAELQELFPKFVQQLPATMFSNNKEVIIIVLNKLKSSITKSVYKLVLLTLLITITVGSILLACIF